MQHSQRLWIDRLQNLYASKYNPIQLEEIVKVLPVRNDLLKNMWEMVTTDFEPTSTRPLPDKTVIARSRREVLSRMPQLRSEQPDKPLLDEGSFHDAKELMRELGRSLSAGQDPRKNENAIAILKKNGYDITTGEN